ncbi:MAG: hypothetical protein LBJ36_06325 [Synergistaceae bacterium]|jgi:alcohol dehydrogenase|nr:hypothetical protein [Synergistaceae bacterium]
MPDLRAKERARELLKKFKGDSYTFGIGILEQVAKIARKQGKKVTVIGDTASKPVVERVITALKKAGLELALER